MQTAKGPKISLTSLLPTLNKFEKNTLVLFLSLLAELKQTKS